MRNDPLLPTLPTLSRPPKSSTYLYFRYCRNIESQVVMLIIFGRMCDEISADGAFARDDGDAGCGAVGTDTRCPARRGSRRRHMADRLPVTGQEGSAGHQGNQGAEQATRTALAGGCHWRAVFVSSRRRQAARHCDQGRIIRVHAAGAGKHEAPRLRTGNGRRYVGSIRHQAP